MGIIGPLLISLALISCRGNDAEVTVKEHDRKDPVVQYKWEPEVTAVGADFVTVSLAADRDAVVVANIRPHDLASSANGEPPPGHGELLGLAAAGMPSQSPQLAIAALKRQRQTMVTFARLTPQTPYDIYLTLKVQGIDSAAAYRILPAITDAELPADWLHNQPPEAFAHKPYRFAPSLGADVTLKVASQPAWLGYDEGRREFVGLPPDEPAADHHLRLVLNRGAATKEANFTLTPRGDPLTAASWHIHDGSRSSFAGHLGSGAVSANIIGAWNQDVTGLGVAVRIVDTGLYTSHPDLHQQIDWDLNRNLGPISDSCPTECRRNDPSPKYADGWPRDHGTEVAGVIAAEGWNGIGGRGVAPGARISAVNLLSPLVTATRFAFIQQLTPDVDIINQGFGAETTKLQANSTIDAAYEDAMYQGASTGRQGRGTVVVKASGNGGEQWQDAAFDANNNLPYPILVGAVNSLGRKASYSNSGAGLWLVAPGGQQGLQATYGSLDASRQIDHLAGIVTTDLSRHDDPCTWGSARQPQFFDPSEPLFLGFSHPTASGFNLGWHELNRECWYTATAHGTGMAAAMVSGVVALMLEARPELSYRDVKYILALSASAIDSQQRGRLGTIAGKEIVKAHGWRYNHGGFRFHRDYGFGMVDAGAAVALARSPEYQLLGPVVDSGWLANQLGGAIPAASTLGQIFAFDFAEHLRIETVQVRLNLTAAQLGYVDIRLLSPAGTEIVLLELENGAGFANLHQQVFLATGFLGEEAQGTWRLVLHNKFPEHDVYLTNWQLRFTGTADREAGVVGFAAGQDPLANPHPDHHRGLEDHDPSVQSYLQVLRPM